MDEPADFAWAAAMASSTLAPCSIAWCSPVSDMAAAERAVHRMLGTSRVRKRRELFRVDAATARQVVEAVAGSLPWSPVPAVFFSRPTSPARSEGGRYHQGSRRAGSWRYGRRRVSMPVRLVAGAVAIGALLVLLKPLLFS